MGFSGGMRQDDIGALLRHLDDSMTGAVDATLEQAGFEIEGRMQDRFRGGAGFFGSAPRQLRRPQGDFLFARTGALAGSFSHDVVGGQRPLERRLRNRTAGTSYGRIQEFGGLVVPKRARALTIPLPDNLTAAGDVRWPSARVLFQEEPERTWIQRSRSGRAFILYRDDNGDVLWLFLLKRSVYIPPRLGFRKTVRDYAPRVVVVLGENIRKELDARKRRGSGGSGAGPAGGGT